MTRLLHIVVILLCASACAWFAQLNSLPEVDNLIDTQVSISSSINSATFEGLKNSAHVAIRQGKYNHEPIVIKAIHELEEASSFIDTLALSFDKVESGEDRVETLLRELFSLKKLNTVALRDTAVFFRAVSRIGPRITALNTISNRGLRRIAIENIRYDSYDLMRAYLDSLWRITESVQYKVDQGVPTREPGWKKGSIAFNPPSVMELGERERVQIRISKNLRRDILTKMPAAETALIDSLIVSDVMIVRLSGDDFDFTSYDEEEQGVTEEGYTQWEFDITPRSTGTHTLFVKVGIVYSVPGIGPTKKFFPVYEKQVQIHVDNIKRLAAFATERWEFLISTFLIPALTWVWSRVRRRKAQV
jgi:hypothetical protein